MAVSNAPPAFLETELRSSLDTRYHWAAASQSYTPVMVLLQYLAEGWFLEPCISAVVHWYGGGRRVTVYDFELTKGSQVVMTHVVENPVVRRLLRQHAYQVIHQRGQRVVDS